jgi:hypothetical protein
VSGETGETWRNWFRHRHEIPKLAKLPNPGEISETWRNFRNLAKLLKSRAMLLIGVLDNFVANNKKFIHTPVTRYVFFAFFMGGFFLILILIFNL